MKKRLFGTFFASTVISIVVISILALLYLSGNGEESLFDFDGEEFTLTVFSKKISFDKEKYTNFTENAKKLLKTNDGFASNFSEQIKLSAESLSRSALDAISNLKASIEFLVLKNT